jgi:16S rRNA (cytosine1402-N4)-methyltransferase
MSDFAHATVLREPALELLLGNQGQRYVDATLGGGGHAEAILATRADVRVVGVDQDPVALDAAGHRLQSYGPRVEAVRGNFRHLDQLVPPDFCPVDGVVFDLGVSSPQLDMPERGFSYQHEAPLDMRMDPDSDRSAFRLINWADERELTRVIREYGEERWASRIAGFVVEARKREPIRTTAQLVDVIKAAIPASARRTGGHPARRTFQALRIWVNDELEALDEGLEAARRITGPGGRVVVISFHSLEDRVVKRRFRSWAEAGQGAVLTRRPLAPDEQEVRDNPRSRSAKLRAFEVSKTGAGSRTGI